MCDNAVIMLLHKKHLLRVEKKMFWLKICGFVTTNMAETVCG